MPLLGTAAMLLSFDIAPEAIAEHDDWHTHEHFPERLSIPGFLRGSRWIASQGEPRYFVMYEVEALATLTSAAYLERLNNPSPWTAKMMPHYRGMTRGFCAVSHSAGMGLGHTALFVRFKPDPASDAVLRDWLVGNVLPGLPATRGLACAHLFEGAVTPPGTNEQRIRGQDAGMDSALMVTGYSAERVTELFETMLAPGQFGQRGATGLSGGIYQLAYTLSGRPASTTIFPA